MILRNLSWLTVSQMVRMITGLLIGTWLTRRLGPEQNGLLGTTQVIGALMGFTAELGLRQILIKELSIRSGEAGRILGTAARVMFVWGTVCYFLALAVSWIWGGEEMLKLGFILYATLPLNAYLAVLSFWDAAHQAQRTARLGLIANVISAMTRVVCIVLGANLLWVAASIVLEAVVCCVVAFWWLAKRGWGGGPLVWDRAIARRLLSESLPLFFAHSGTLLLLRADQMMIYQLRGAAEAGVYAAATRLSEIAYTIGPMIILTFMPILSRAFESDPERYRQQRAWLFGMVSLVGYGAVLAWCLMGNWVVHLLYGEAFSGAAAVLMIHGLATLPYLHGELRTALLVIERKTVWSIRCAAVGLVLNIALNFWWVPEHGAVGAAWATAVAYTLAWFLSSLVLPSLQGLGRQQLRALLAPVWIWGELRQWRTLMS